MKISGNTIKDEAQMKRLVKELEISDITQYTYSIASGWLSKIFYKRTTNIGSLKQIETYVITEKK